MLNSYRCYLGQYENHKYTIEARSFKDLRKRLGDKFIHLKNGRWYKVSDVDGLPQGAMRFVVKDRKTYPRLGLCREYILIIPDVG